MMPYEQPWVVEPTTNCFPSQSPMDDLPRTMLPMSSRIPEWSGSSTAPSYPPVRQLKPETRRLPTDKHWSDWAQAKSPEASFSLYKASHPAGALPPHSQSPSSSTNPTATAGLSPTSTTSMQYHSLPLNVMSPAIKLETDYEVAPPANPDEAEDTIADPPYSQLIYEALQSTPGKKLPLQGIYLWFEQHTAKGRDRGSKGWQNSIRHNLSMNAGFEAVREETTAGKKPVNYWRLTNEAVNNGIQSTTRYRKPTNYKKSAVSDPPAPQRQRSGAKGGKATKITTRFRSIGHEEHRRERSCRQHQQQEQELHHQYQMQPQRAIPSQHQLPKNHHSYSQYFRRSSPTTTAAAGTPALSQVYAGGPTATTASMTRPPAVEGFNPGTLVGYTNTPPCTAPTSIFCDMAGLGPDCLVFDAGFMGLDGIHSSFAGTEISATSDLHIGL